MRKKHEVRINVADGKKKQHILTTRKGKVPARIARLLFGDYSEVVILQPGRSVQEIEIHEREAADEG